MPQSKKGVPKQGTRKLRKNLHQSRLEGEKHQTELRSMEAAMQEKDGFIKELRESLTKRDDELEKVREAALESKEIILQLQTQNKELQSKACKNLNLVDNSTLKEEINRKEKVIVAKETELLAAKETISKMEKECAKWSVEEKDNNKQVTEAFLKKEKALQTGLEKVNEDELLNILLKKDMMLYKKKKDFQLVVQTIYCLEEEIAAKSVEHKKNTELLLQSFLEKENAILIQNKKLEHDLRNKDETIARLKEKVEKQDVDLDEKLEEIKVTKELFKEKKRHLKDEVRIKSEEIGLYQWQLEIITNKLACTTKELDFERTEVDCFASGVKAKLDNLYKAGEKHKVENITDNEILNLKTKKQKLIVRLCNVFRCGKKKVSKSDKRVVGESTC